MIESYHLYTRFLLQDFDLTISAITESLHRLIEGNSASSADDMDIAEYDTDSDSDDPKPSPPPEVSTADKGRFEKGKQ